MTTSTVPALPGFMQYQQQFCAHVRDPRHARKPAQVRAERMQVYTEIVFNNFYSSVSACFPVAQLALGRRLWRRLVRSFFIHHRCSSPLFRKIPEEFLQYLSEIQQHDPALRLPAYLPHLAHYEWVEMALAVADVPVALDSVEPAGDLLEGPPVFAPALALLSYDYPVQRISRQFKPKAVEPVQLLVFRDPQDVVRFVELNPVTARLLALLQTGTVNGRQALLQIASELGQADTEMVVGFGTQILEDLRQQGALLGISRAP